MNEIFSATWVPLLVFAISFGYGILLVTTKNPKSLIDKRNPRRPKDPEKYAVEGGKLLLFMAAGSLLMCALIFVNIYLATFESLAVFMIFVYLWKKVADKYGPA